MVNAGDESAVPTTKTGDELKAAHTPLPWEVGGTGSGWLWITGPDKDESVICDIVNRMLRADPTEEDIANAELIVRAVNSHDVLVVALKTVETIFNKGAACTSDLEWNLAGSTVYAALTLAEVNAPANKRDTNDAESVGSLT